MTEELYKEIIRSGLLDPKTISYMQKAYNLWLEKWANKILQKINARIVYPDFEYEYIVLKNEDEVDKKYRKTLEQKNKRIKSLLEEIEKKKSIWERIFSK